jgi:hypothetical protein
MAGVLLLTWLILMPSVLAADPVRSFLSSVPFGDVLLHNPGRMRYVAVLVLPILAALGVQGLLEDPPPVHRLFACCAAGALLWVGLPLVAGGDVSRWRLFALMLIPATVALVAARKLPRARVALPLLLVLELGLGAVAANRHTGDEILYGLEGPVDRPLAFQPLRAPNVDTEAFLRRTAIVDVIGDDRYLTWAPPAAAYQKGYLFAQDPADWPALANERGSLFGIRDALGYNPIQLPAYWRWIRERNPLPMYYNASVLARPALEDLSTLGVRYLVVPEGVTPTVPGDVVMTADGYDLVEVRDTQNLTIGQSVTVDRRSLTEIDVDGGPIASSVRVAEAYDPGWTATTDDGEPASIAPDGPVMRVTFVGDSHAVMLSYHDAWVIGSLWAGAAVWLSLAVAAGFLNHRERSLARRSPP